MLGHNPGHICHDGTPRSRRAVVCCGGSRWQRSPRHPGRRGLSPSPSLPCSRSLPWPPPRWRSPRPLDVEGGCRQRGPDHGHRRRHGPDRWGLGPTTFTKPGPFAAGEATLTLPSDGAQVEVWYPASPGSVKGVAPATYNLSDWLPPTSRRSSPPATRGSSTRRAPTAACPLPKGVSRSWSSATATRAIATSRASSRRASPPGLRGGRPDFLASDLTALLSGKTGTAASDEADLAEQADTISLMGSENARHSSTLHNKIDLSKVAAVGHSLAGRSPKRPRPLTLASRPSSARGRPSARSGRPAPVQGARSPTSRACSWSERATTSSGQEPSPAPIAPWSSRSGLITLTGAGHLVFADICQLAPGQVACWPPPPPST